MKQTNLTRDHSDAVTRGLVAATAARSFSWVEELANDSGTDITEGAVVVVLADGTIQLANVVNEPRPTGVALDDIADGDSGQVCFGGPVDLVQVVASVTSGDYGQTSTTPGEAQITTGPSTAFCEFTDSGTTPSAFLWGGRGGGGFGGGGSGSGSGTPPWFNVMDPAYGAVGDGTTDDTAAINLAIAALLAQGCGVLYFPCGTYKVTSSLTTITAPCKVMGDGWTTGASGPISKINFTSTSTSLFTVSANGCEFRDLAMVQTGGTASAGAAITSTGGTLTDYDHVLFDGFYIGIDQENSNAWSARRCYFGTSRKYGIKVRNTAIPDAGDWNVTDCYFTNSVAADAAIRVESSGGGKIIGCKINGGSSGAGRFATGIDLSIGNGVNTSVLLVAGTSIENVNGDAIRVVTSGTGTYSHIVIADVEALLSNSTGFLLNASGAGISLINLDACSASTNGTARAAISLTSVTNSRIGAVTYAGFNAALTTSGTSTLADDTGSIAAEVRITGTPTSGQVPIASSGTAAAWGTAPGTTGTDANIWRPLMSSGSVVVDGVGQAVMVYGPA